MGFLKKITRPISRALDKIIPNEIKPALPFLAAAAPFMAPGLMGLGGNTMLSRALMSGGLNIGAQLAQEGSEGEFSGLSALMAAGTGALSAPNAASTIRGVDPNFVGPRPAAEGILGQGKEYLARGAEFLGPQTGGVTDILGKGGTQAGLNMETLKAASIPFTQGTTDLAVAENRRAMRDYEKELADYEASIGDSSDMGNRALAIRQSMEAYGFPEDEILAAIEAAGYANGGRVGLKGGGMDYMSTKPSMMGNPAVMENIENMREFKIMNPNIKDIEDYSIDLKETKEPDFSGIKEVIKNVDTKEKEEKLDDIKNLMAYEPGVPTTGDLYDLNNPDYEGINKKVIIEFIEEGIPLGYTSPEEYFDDFYGIGSLKKDKPKKIMTAKDGGLMNFGGREMDMRTGGFIPIGKKERADDVPARLSKNEFVMTADAVRAAGGGSVNEGARRMYNLMNNLEARV